MAAAAAAAADEGGAGGKFRKRPSRRPHTTTPYDRPPTAIRAAAAGGGSGGWISKLVDPASKLITSSAHRFFASVFRKRLTAPPSPSPSPPPPPSQEANQESRNKRMETVTTAPPGAQGLAIVEVSNVGNSSDGSSIAEIERALMQKTFTRSEIERLMGLLHARTPDSSAGDGVKKSQANYSKLVALQNKPESFADIPVLENGSEAHRVAGVTSTPVVSSRHLEEDIASPADLAKAYMGCRPSKASPSMLGFRSQAFKQEATLLRNTSSFQKSSVMLPVPRSSIRSGVPDNAFMTPRSRGRSAIYNMARTPYSRVSRLTPHSAARLTIDGYGVASSSSSQSILEQNGFSESRKVVPKRRISVLDDDVGSLGPIRKIRQKLSAKSSGVPLSGAIPISTQRSIAGSNAEQLYLPSTQKPLDEPKQNISQMQLEDGANSIPGYSFTPVPTQSSKTAEKILQQLDEFVSPSKEKSKEAKLAAGSDMSPAKLNTDMLHGRALRSLESVDTSKFLRSVEVSSKLDDSSQKQGKVEGNCPIKFDPSEKVAMHDSDATLFNKDSTPLQNSHSTITNFIASSPQNKRVFQMSAHEDNLDMDDGNTGQDGPVPGEKLDTLVVEGKGSAAAAAIRVEKASVITEVKPSADSVLIKSTDLRTFGSSVIAENSINSTFSATTAPSTTGPSTLLLHSGVPPQATDNAPPVFSFGSEKVNGVPTLPFSSSSSGNQSAAFDFAAPSNSKPESSNSFATEKGDCKNELKDGESVGKPDGAPSFVASTSTSPSLALSTTLPLTTGLFSFATSGNNSSSNNGPIYSNLVFTSSASAVDGNNTTKSIFSGISPVCASTAATNSTAAAPSSSATSPPAPIFKFGSGGAPSALDFPNPVTSGGDTSGLVVKAAQEKTTTFNFGGASAISTGGSCFSSSAPSSTANNLPQGAFPFGSGSGSAGITQSFSPATDVSSFSQSVPCQFGSSRSTPVFGSTAFSTSSPLFGSSNTASNSFGSGTDLGSCSSALGQGSTVSILNSTSSASYTCTATSEFGSNWQSNKTPIFSSASNSAAAPSSGFSFGLSHAPALGSGQAPTSTLFGSSTTTSTLSSMFSFTSASAATSSLPSSSPLQPVFGNPNSGFASGATASGNNDQMSLEDSMAEDNVQASPTPTPGFMFNSAAPSGAPSFQFGGQQQNPNIPANPSFQFGGQQQNQTVPANPVFQFGGQQQNQTAPANSPFQTAPANSPFQFGGQQPNQTPAPANSPFLFGGQQQNQTVPANPSPFEATGSLDFNAVGGSFSLGSTGTNKDKTGRRIIKVTRNKQQRK